MAFDAGNLALDMLNTCASRDGRRGDLLSTTEGLLTWLHGAGLASEAELAELKRSPPESRLLLAEAARLREAVSDLLRAFVASTQLPEPAVAEVNRILATHAVGVTLASGTEGHRLVSVPHAVCLAAMLAPVAEAAARILVEADPARVRRCTNQSCSFWFLDASRNGRRRWCSMARCGNRAKVAAHYRRQRVG